MGQDRSHSTSNEADAKMMNHRTFEMTAGQYDLVYNFTSFTLASMMATTIFLWLRLGSIAEKYKSAVVISGLVTFIAAYHYIRIFNSWVDAYAFPAPVDGALGDPVPTGTPFNDAYRNLGVLSALMIILGYPGELILDPESLGTRWVFWAAGMAPFLFIVHTLLVGLQGAIEAESDPTMKSKVNAACVWTVVSWCTYPVVYIMPMLGVSGAQAVVNIQIGYCV